MAETRGNLVAGQQITKAVSLVRPLSSGGMGAVWLADHDGLKTQVVVKFMLVSLDASDSARTRFSREAAAAAQVKSPHVVQMLDHGVSDDGVPFIVMEHLEGRDLGDEIKATGALDPVTVVVIVSQVAKALSKVHAAGLLHRDIKPDNIFLCAEEEEVFAKLLDFGIAKSSTVDEDSGPLDGETKTGQVVGTPYYMSPEQVTAQKVIDSRSDLWALGVVAYEALTGQRPYDGPSFGALAVKIATGSPPKPSEANATLPPSVDLWFAKACARDPHERFANAKEMAEAFRAAFEGVLRLPPSLVSGDSGQRGLTSSSGARSGARSGPGASGDLVEVSAGDRTESPTLGLAATALDDSDGARRSLGRSEAGVTVVESAGSSKSRGSSLVVVGGAVALTIAVGAALLWSQREPDRAFGATTMSAPPPSGGATPTPVAPTASTSPVVSSSPTAPSSAGAASAATLAATAPVSPSSTTSVPTHAATAPVAFARPVSSTAPASSHGSTNGASRPGLDAAAPKGSAKPPIIEPDLY